MSCSACDPRLTWVLVARTSSSPVRSTFNIQSRLGDPLGERRVDSSYEVLCSRSSVLDRHGLIPPLVGNDDRPLSSGQVERAGLNTFRSRKRRESSEENCPAPERRRFTVLARGSRLFSSSTSPQHDLDDPGRLSAYEPTRILQHPGRLLLPPAPRRLWPHGPADNLPAS